MPWKINEDITFLLQTEPVLDEQMVGIINKNIDTLKDESTRWWGKNLNIIKDMMGFRRRPGW